MLNFSEKTDSSLNSTDESNELQALENESSKAKVKSNSASSTPVSSNYMSNVHSYETEWRNIKIMAQDQQLTKMKHISLSGDLKVSKFRSVYWNVLLGVLKSTPDTWLEQRRKQRQYFKELKLKYNFNPKSLDLDQDNPLSQSQDSVWNQHFRDQELLSLIRQDVIRTNPSVDFYRKENIQEIMINILFLYAREFPKVCYRQGMHEILAPLIFILHCDHQNLGHILDLVNVNIDPILVEVLDQNYLEEDSYHMFVYLMSSLEMFYRINDMTITQSGEITVDKNSPSSPSSSDRKKSEIEVINQLNMIRDKILAKQDLHLHNHFLKLDIPLALFGIRWLRLLFGREFPLQDLLILWDALIAIGDNLELTHYILVAMLIHIRDKLLSSDYATCLTLTMRYPQNVDVMHIIRHALHMLSPDKYQCPPNAIVYLKYRTENSTKGDRRFAVSTSSSLANDRFRSNSLPRNRMKSVEHRRTTKNEVASLSMLANQPNSLNSGEELGIVDGYFVDDPEVLKMELQDAYNLMTVSRLKLMQYLKTLRKYIPGNQVDELHQSLDGIEELCSLLKPKHQYLFNISAPVDAAVEATHVDIAISRTRREEPPKTLNLKTKNMPDTSSNFAANSLNSNRYEVPDNRLSKNVSRLINNRKEVEMRVFHDFKNVEISDNNVPGIPPIDPAGDRRNSE